MLDRWTVAICISIVFSVSMISGVNSISCFVCSSHNTSDPNCEDPFHPAYSNYTKECEVPKQHHIGTFPAKYCVKIIGESASTSTSLVLRTCVLENMGSQCGVFKFGGKQLTGCILTCNSNGCNTGSSLFSCNVSTCSLIIILICMLIQR